MPNDEELNVDHMLRPKATVLPDSAQIPEQNLIDPPPNQFTHEVMREQPFYYLEPQANPSPDGIFAEGTVVLLVVQEGGSMCRVIDGRGLYVATEFAGLRPRKPRKQKK